MSWDIFAQDFPDVASVEDVPDDFEPASLGSRDAMIARIAGAIPSADFADPAWGLIDGLGWSIEVNLGDDAECNGFALHVRGGGNEAIDAVAAILAATGLRAVDAQTGEFFDKGAALESFGGWQAYRDHVAEPPTETP